MGPISRGILSCLRSKQTNPPCSVGAACLTCGKLNRERIKRVFLTSSVTTPSRHLVYPAGFGCRQNKEKRTSLLPSVCRRSTPRVDLSAICGCCKSGSDSPVRTDCRFRIRSLPLSARISRGSAKFLKLPQHDTSSTVKFACP